MKRKRLRYMTQEDREYLTHYLLGKLCCGYEDEDLIHKKMFLLYYMGIKIGYKFLWDERRGVYSPELDDCIDDMATNRPRKKDDDAMLDCALDYVCSRINNLHLQAIKQKVRVDPILWYQLVADTVFLRLTLSKPIVLKTISKMDLPENSIDVYNAAYQTAKKLKKKR